MRALDDAVELTGSGYVLRVVATIRLRDVMYEATAIGRRLEELRRCSALVRVQFGVDDAYSGMRYRVSTAMGVRVGAWSPVNAGMSAWGWIFAGSVGAERTRA